MPSSNFNSQLSSDAVTIPQAQLAMNRLVGRDSVEPTLSPEAMRALRASRCPGFPRMLTAFASLRSKVGSTESRPTAPAFKGNVKTIRTDVLVDRAAEDLYPTWEKNRDQWNLTGGDHPYHYLGSAIWFTRIGHAMAEAMKELLSSEVIAKPLRAERF